MGDRKPCFYCPLMGKKTKDVNINQLIVVFMFWPKKKFGSLNRNDHIVLLNSNKNRVAQPL